MPINKNVEIITRHWLEGMINIRGVTDIKLDQTVAPYVAKVRKLGKVYLAHDGSLTAAQIMDWGPDPVVGHRRYYHSRLYQPYNRVIPAALHALDMSREIGVCTSQLTMGAHDHRMGRVAAEDVLADLVQHIASSGPEAYADLLDPVWETLDPSEIPLLFEPLYKEWQARQNARMVVTDSLLQERSQLEAYGSW